VNFDAFLWQYQAGRGASKRMPRVVKMRLQEGKKLQQNKKYDGQKTIKIKYCLL
jgi:hypothetical protein